MPQVNIAITKMGCLYEACGVSSEARVLNVGLSFHLPPYLLCAGSEGSGESQLSLCCSLMP